MHLLDGLLGCLAGWGAFVVFIVSSPKRRLWLPMPGYVRLPTLVFGLFLFWRGADELWLVLHPAVADYTAVVGMLDCALAVWYFGAVAISVLKTRAPTALWRKLWETAQAYGRGGADAP